MLDNAQEDNIPPQPGQVIGQQQSPSQSPFDDPGLPKESEEPEESLEDDSESITWSASEFVDHNKGVSWFLGLAVAMVLIAAAVYFFTKSTFSAVIVLVMGIIFGVAAGRQPRVLSYTVNGKGIKIGEKFFPYSAFKSFSVIEQGAFRFISLISFKRFVPAISVYYEPDDEDQILNTLGTYLPHEERDKDLVEHLMHRIKF